MVSKLQPLADRVLVKPIEKEEKTKSGIYLPDTAKEKPQEGEILAVGPGKIPIPVYLSFYSAGPTPETGRKPARNFPHSRPPSDTRREFWQPLETNIPFGPAPAGVPKKVPARWSMAAHLLHRGRNRLKRLQDQAKTERLTAPVLF